MLISQLVLVLIFDFAKQYSGLSNDHECIFTLYINMTLRLRRLRFYLNLARAPESIRSLPLCGSEKQTCFISCLEIVDTAPAAVLKEMTIVFDPFESCKIYVLGSLRHLPLSVCSFAGPLAYGNHSWRHSASRRVLSSSS